MPQNSVPAPSEDMERLRLEVRNKELELRKIELMTQMRLPNNQALEDNKHPVAQLR